MTAPTIPVTGVAQRNTHPSMPDLAAPLVAAASLIAAALVGHAGVGSVSVTVSADEISVQVPLYIGDEPTRALLIAAYAHALGVPVQRRTTRQHTWIEARGAIAAHQVHVWTIADDPAPVATPAVA